MPCETNLSREVQLLEHILHVEVCERDEGARAERVRRTRGREG
jgi:hypothetical protein